MADKQDLWNLINRPSTKTKLEILEKIFDVWLTIWNKQKWVCKFRSTSNTCSEKPRTPVPMISEHLFRKTSNTFSIFSELLLAQKKII